MVCFRTVVLLACCLLSARSASATWSVIAVDRASGRVVISSATCVPQQAFAGFPAKDLRDVQAIVVPGKGVAAAQANVDSTRANQKLIYAELQKGTAPDAILAMLKNDPRIAGRQFGIVDLEGRMAGFSGANNQAVSLDKQGQVPGTQIFYSIQGNVLKSEAVVTEAVAAFTSTKGALTDRVMAAMEAADGSGGDSRCTCPPWPADGTAPKIPCDGKTAHVAYILMAEKSDTNGDSHNNGKYAMYINVSQPAPDHAKGIKEGENLNPVKTLRMRYDAWRKTQPASFT